MSLCIPSKILDQHLVVLGKTGAGKSSALRHIVEHLLSHKKRVCIIDPKGDWWGLKSSADGKSPGFPVIAFGDFKNENASDVPINAQSGRHVAELITSGNRPAIIGFRGWMTSHMVQFWIDFAAGVFNANSGELYLVGDEFHNFAPKGKIMDPQAGKCLHWSNRLMSEGRGLGIVCLIASQRPQKVHNDTLTSCETLVAMRVIHAADRGAVDDWIKGCGDKEQGKDVLNELAGMARGEAFVWSPENGFGPKRIVFPMFESFDSFAPPQLQKKVSERGWADVDLGAVKEKLASVIEEAKANDPRELKREVAVLKTELAKARTAPLEKSHTEFKTKEMPVLKDAQIARLEKVHEQIAEEFTRASTHANALIARVSEVMKPITLALEKAKSLPTRAPFPANLPDRSPLLTGQPSAPARTPPPARETRALPGSENGAGLEVRGKKQDILDALAFFESLGVKDLKKGQLAAFSDASPTSSAYSNNLGALRSAGLIDYPRSGYACLTNEGRQLARAQSEICSLGDLHALWLCKLPGKKADILRALMAIYPEAMSKLELAEKIGASPTSSAYTNNLGSLRTLGVIDYPQTGYVAATDLLFPPGLT